MTSASNYVPSARCHDNNERTSDAPQGRQRYSQRGGGDGAAQGQHARVCCCVLLSWRRMDDGL